jgi:LCP family protein required for cell wall assembly
MMVVSVGVLLVMGGFVVLQVQRSIQDVAVEVFDPELAAESIDTISPEDRQNAIDAVELDEITDATVPEILAPVELPATRNPATLSPPLPDEMFDTYLLLGTDENGFRADVIMLVLLPEDGSDPIVVSLPRDLYVENPCTGRYARLNSGMNGCGSDISGPTLMALSVQQFTGITPDHFVVVDFDGFEKVVDALGGVGLCFEYAVFDRDAALDLPAGCQQLDGDQALAWVRSRKTRYKIDGTWTSQGSSDFSRQAHQQELLFALAHEVASFSSITRLTGVARTAAASLTISDDLSLSDLIALGWTNRHIQPSDVITLSIETKSLVTSAGAFVEEPTVRFNEILAQVYPPAQRDVEEPAG